MADNVFILGAGFSCDAGIPLMGSFVERMWEIAQRKRDPLDNKPLSAADQELLEQATGLINDLDSYHGRANFDDRNIEDLLSILSFKQLAGGRGSKTSLDRMTKAIARTIELTCKLKNRNLIARPSSEENPSAKLYRSFWKALFDTYAKTQVLPTIITFNYDLVLERSLVDLLTGVKRNLRSEEKQSPVRSFKFNYFNKGPVSPAYEIQRVAYNGTTRDPFSQVEGQRLARLSGDRRPEVEISLLKLHGSLNFPKDSKATDELDLESAADDPQILPPLFNKDTAALGSSMWAQALRELQEAKNVVVVGYSLPQTDIYMQYFLRASLGPNVNLNKITVYDPSLFVDGPAGQQLKSRYQECFSPQLQRRINFMPTHDDEMGARRGTTRHFIEDLTSSPNSLMFF
jgi:hypothetical protein